MKIKGKSLKVVNKLKYLKNILNYECYLSK
ncbi:MAG: hypothetical protein PPFGHCPK_01338 [Spiroplasma endosymbiont of Drosophila atripex]|nr:MAG: hypothetical protein PPFGHCPK_00018 [Spiroplasma endosymbiont of Drosophila atripex]WDA53883.1 MAG: hypothetical protein PPFGHCPK_00297 [Spiroplasma endosymbiont of Drosophila atripex]WDA54607.1 MAG: hypothetical protein PPFGHCPK_01063 [Spiroplasma endosymbiont of Drosophila atripex]WDA54857.1 MAG: hypothetical protein PPFGHCPK_01338 [Spiroplasma endosymbiont of Drosophila atripex]